MSIKIFYDNVRFRVRKAGEIKKFLEKVIRDENRIPGDLNFIFTNDEKLIEINREFLKHDYYTDVISFDYSTKGNINGEVYISIDTIRNNAKANKVKTEEELLRVMIHGTLHLAGYDDVNDKLRSRMFKQQELKLVEYMRGKK